MKYLIFLGMFYLILAITIEFYSSLILTIGRSYINIYINIDTIND
jgi:hypothetical protein